MAHTLGKPSPGSSWTDSYGPDDRIDLPSVKARIVRSNFLSSSVY